MLPWLHIILCGDAGASTMRPDVIRITFSFSDNHLYICGYYIKFPRETHIKKEIEKEKRLLYFSIYLFSYLSFSEFLYISTLLKILQLNEKLLEAFVYR